MNLFNVWPLRATGSPQPILSYPTADPKALAQILEPVKQELCTRDGLAIASLNKHRSFFGECYEINFGDEAAHSACVAFGIERWLHALFQAHGSDPATWPEVGVT